jgi:hypothetical protein
MRTISFFIFLFLLPGVCISQSHFDKNQKFVVNGKIQIDKDGNGDIKDVTFTLLKDTVEILKLFEKNSYNLNLEFDSKYLITISKPNYITKQYLINTKDVPIERLKDGFEPYQMINNIQKQPNDSVFTFTQPVGTIYFIESDDDFSYKTDYRYTIKKKQ